MSESDITSLINEEPVKRTKVLIRLFRESSDADRQRNTIALLHHIGDEEVAGNFFADLLERGELRPMTKFWVEVFGGFPRLKNHSRLSRARAAVLRGQSPAKVLMETIFPEGSACSLGKKRVRKDKQPAPAKRKSMSKSAQILTFSKK